MNAPQDILDTLEKIDDDFDEKEVEVVKCSDPDFAKEEFGLGGQLPFLAMFENEVRGCFDNYPSLNDGIDINHHVMKIKWWKISASHTSV